MSNLLFMEVDVSTFCSQAADILHLIGWFLFIFKIAIPIIIIAYGMFDLGKAVTAAKDDEIKTATKRLMYRAIAGVAIFFVPTIVLWLFSLINGYDPTELSNYNVCKACILTPWDDSNCKSTAGK